MSSSLITSIAPKFRTIDRLKVRYAESGAAHERTLLFTSPWPESIYAFAPIWTKPAEHARLFVIDLPGFGASEGRDDLLSPRATGDFLARELPTLAELLPEIATPVTLINGRHDRVVPVVNAEFLHERLPNSRLEIIDAGHFVSEEAPTEYASILLDSIMANGSARRLSTDPASRQRGDI